MSVFLVYHTKGDENLFAYFKAPDTSRRDTEEVPPLEMQRYIWDRSTLSAQVLLLQKADGYQNYFKINTRALQLN